MNITLPTTNMSNASSPETSTTELDPRLVAADNLWKYLSPFLILLGTFGNVMTIIVLCRKSMWKLVTSPYLAVLSLADIFVLYTGLLRQWIRYYFDLDIRDLSPVGCRIHIFLVYTSVDFSVWMLVAVSVDRFISVCFPFKAKTLCTRKRAVWTMLLIFICLSILNSHFFVGFGSQYDPDTSELISHCTYLYEDYATFSDDIWPWIDLSVFSMVPFCIILVCNISLIAKFFSCRRMNKVSPSNKVNGQRAKPSSMRALLISLNTLFLVTTAPISIYLIGYPEWIITATYEDYVQLTLWWAIVNQLMYLNNSVNFMFYCISGPRFRRELKAMCGCRGAVGPTVTATESALPTGVSVIPDRIPTPRVPVTPL